MSHEPVVTRCETVEEAAAAASEVLATAIASARTVRGRAHVALSGGSVVGQAYRMLGPELSEWRDVHLWYGDERCVAPDDPESNAGMVRQALLAPGATEHRMQGELGPDAGAEAYAQELGDTVMDLTLNGMGPDGHTASLFPGHALLEAGVTVAGVHDSPKPPPERITLTLPALNASHHLMLLVTGADKAPALARVLAGPDRGTPASLLERDKLDVVADAAALG